MHIDYTPKLDFDDVLIRPMRSESASRSEIILEREFTTKHSKKVLSGCPIIAANMDTVGTFAMASALAKHRIYTCLHKFYEVDKLIEFFNLTDSFYSFYTLGIGDEDIKKLKTVSKSAPIKNICVDVANGYTAFFQKKVIEIRELFPNAVLMAGNIATPEMVQELLMAGFADIVKIGIGPGCFAENTRILMANGTYKNIQEIKIGDRVINKHGHAVNVINAFCSGFKPVKKIRHANFYTETYVTSDHQFWCGDLSSVEKSTVSSRGYKNVLAKKTRFNESKFGWLPIGSEKFKCLTLPSQINFEMPDNFHLNLDSYFIRKTAINEQTNKDLKPSYELGYLFGTFLGDGSAKLSKHPISVKGTGSIVWHFGAHEKEIVNKVSKFVKTIFNRKVKVKTKDNMTLVKLHSLPLANFFSQFGKKKNKHLPENLLCKNQEYIKGIFDGLIDSDGHVSKDGRVCFKNTSSRLMELFGVLCQIVNGSFPNMDNHINYSELTKVESLSLHARLNKSHNKRHVGENYVVKLLEECNLDIIVPVYDIEVDCDSHSFIANNTIVHNSACTTRLITGVGYPQLSAIIECANAAHGLSGLICGDGGCRYPADVVKGFSAGADFMMLGGMLAGCDECEGEWEFEKGVVTNLCENTSNYDPSLIIKKRLKFYGMSSKEAQEKYYNGMSEYKAAEGRAMYVDYKGPVDNTIRTILGGLRSACSYVGAMKLKDLSKCTTFVQVPRIHTNTKL